MHLLLHLCGLVPVKDGVQAKGLTGYNSQIFKQTLRQTPCAQSSTQSLTGLTAASCASRTLS